MKTSMSLKLLMYNYLLNISFCQNSILTLKTNSPDSTLLAPSHFFRHFTVFVLRVCFLIKASNAPPPPHHDVSRIKNRNILCSVFLHSQAINLIIFVASSVIFLFEGLFVFTTMTRHFYVVTFLLSSVNSYIGNHAAHSLVVRNRCCTYS